MNDRELIELAAKAVGVNLTWHGQNPVSVTGADYEEWNPLVYDDDALRLAVKLKLDVFTGQGMRGDITTVCAPPEHDMESCGERHGDDPCAATRLAIVRAAAEIGKSGD